ncbi:MAG: response regulator [Bdellovibrio sp.]|nr:response regulator [Bdellovibrio sp.]
MFQNLKPKILVVDDMPAMRKLICQVLEGLGFYRIQEAEDGMTAWELMKEGALMPEESFHLVIADWNMPGFSGIDLLRAIRTNPMTSSVPFLMITARGEQAHIDEALFTGVSDYLVKPFDQITLSKKITELFFLSHLRVTSCLCFRKI